MAKPRHFPRFIADAPQDGAPYGRWAETLAGHVRESAKGLDELPEGAGPPGQIAWFPERGWGGRLYLPFTATEQLDADAGRDTVEYFGHVRFERPEGGEPGAIEASCDWTDVTAADNPGWAIDINDSELAPWQGDGPRRGEVTLVWGIPMVRGAEAALAELDGELVDQARVVDGRFTLVALDAVDGFGDERLLLTVRLLNKRGDEVAAESLYDEGGEGDEEGADE